MEHLLENIWISNKDYVRRVLLALTRDPDLAEDCLQETYLRARAGIAGYQGGSAQAWLTTIARNVYFSHVRKRSFSSELSMDTLDDQADPSSHVGSDHYLTLLQIRETMSALEPDLRGALIMKHYGGCSYEEIAARLSCTPDTAKHRVWRAMQKLRAAIGSVEDDMCCDELAGTRILDWLYDALSTRKTEEIRAHATLCVACRKRLAEFRSLSGLLEKVEGENRILTLVDLDERGRSPRYVWTRMINRRAEPTDTFAWSSRRGWSVDYLVLQGEPVEIVRPRYEKNPGFEAFHGTFPNPIEPGESMDAMFVACPPAGSHWDAQPLDGRKWHYHHRHSPFPKRQGLFVLTVKLPEGAKLLSTHVEPHKISTRSGRVSVTWQRLVDPADPSVDPEDWQFESHLEYVLPATSR